MSASGVEQSIPVPAPLRLFPLVRQLSRPLTSLLLKVPATPNHVTIASTVVGLVSAWCFWHGGTAGSLAGVALFILSQVLDNCDGEIARLKGLQSRFGGRLDDLGDWLVHSALFLALGASASQDYGSEIWLWLGIIASAGVTLEYMFSLFRGHDEEPTVDPASTMADPTKSVRPADLPGEASWTAQMVYVFRVLIDADFCFILPLFVLSDLLWVLLPAAAIGNHIYWATAFYEDAWRFHA